MQVLGTKEVLCWTKMSKAHDGGVTGGQDGTT